MHSVIKYFGGKTNMTDIFKSNFPRSFDIYVEGFGGGASLLFSKEQKGVEIYNDLDENVYSLFKVLSDKELFEQLKEKMDLTYYSEQLRQEFKSDLKGGGICLFLTERTNSFMLIELHSMVQGVSLYPIM